MYIKFEYSKIRFHNTKRSDNGNQNAIKDRQDLKCQQVRVASPSQVPSPAADTKPAMPFTPTCMSSYSCYIFLALSPSFIAPTSY